MRRYAGATLLVAIVSEGMAAQPVDDTVRRANELLALTAEARNAWAATHADQLTPELGRSLAAQGLALQKQGRYDDALVAFGLALRVGEASQAGEVVVSALHGEAEVRRIQGQPRVALTLLFRALGEAQQQGDARAQARLSGSLGLVQLQLGELRAARETFEQQLASFEGLGDVRGRGQAQSNLGIALGSEGRYAEAAEAFERSRALMESAGYAPGVARAFNNLGNVLRRQGRNREALVALERSLELKQAAGNRPELPTTLRNIGALLHQQGALPQALEFFRRSASLAEELGQRQELCDALGDQGATLLEAGQTNEARLLLERSSGLAEELGNPASGGSALQHLGELYRALGEHDRADQYFRRSLELLERSGDQALWAAALTQLADSRWRRGDLTGALAPVQEAVELARRFELLEQLWPALLVLGRSQRGLGQAAAAERAWGDAVAAIEELRSQLAGSEMDRVGFSAPRSAPYLELLALLAQRGEIEAAFSMAERSKARVLLDSVASHRPPAGRVIGEQERAEEARLEGALLSTSAELRACQTSGSSGSDPDRTRLLRARRDHERLALADFRTRMFAAHPELRAARGELRELGPEDLPALLGRPGDLLLEYAWTPEGLLLFAAEARPGAQPALRLHRLDGSAALGELVRSYRARLASRDLNFAADSERLYAALLLPVAEELRRARRVLLVPDGPLWELPFQTLRAKGGRYLIEQAEVAYAPSLTVLREMRARRSSRPHASKLLLALGNPDLGPGARRRSASVLLGDQLEPLPEAERQVRQIERLYRGGEADVRVGREAREQWLKSVAGDYRILHFATHGVLDDLNPLYSQLVLASPAPGELEDGLLEAHELLDLELKADLAVLSACETGRGRTRAGEGLVGLVWAFFVGGCPATVATQWKVEAGSASRLMLAFHGAVRRGQRPAAALREAAQALLAQPGSRHPFFWGGFVVVGDGE